MSSIELTQLDQARITILAQSRGISTSQVIGEAIQAKEFIDAALAQGAELVLRWNDHCYQRVVIS